MLLYNYYDQYYRCRNVLGSFSSLQEQIAMNRLTKPILSDKSSILVPRLESTPKLTFL